MTLGRCRARFRSPGDEWADGRTGLGVDVMFRTPAFIEDELDRVLVRHQARAGYSTCLWHNVLASRLLFDRRGFYAALQARAGAATRNRSGAPWWRATFRSCSRRAPRSATSSRGPRLAAMAWR